jgi:2-polyprenyl-3-methyl-5-hydroxy-6-metoxy-1,4-benzoquinol methylase
MENTATFLSPGCGWPEADLRPSHPYVEPAILALLRKHGCRSVLDLGCGIGLLVKRLKAEGFEPVGCEPNPGDFELAGRNAAGVKIYALGAEDDPSVIQERPFDAVVSTEVIEHLYDPSCLFAFARGVLRENGGCSSRPPITATSRTSG